LPVASRSRLERALITGHCRKLETGNWILATFTDMATVNPLLQQIDAIAKEKGVEREIIISAVQDALEAAARKRYKSEALRARFNTDTGQLELYAVKKIVEDVTDPSTQDRKSTR